MINWVCLSDLVKFVIIIKRDVIKVILCVYNIEYLRVVCFNRICSYCNVCLIIIYYDEIVFLNKGK